MLIDTTFDEIKKPVETDDKAGGSTTTYQGVAYDVAGSIGKRSNLPEQKEIVSDIDRIQYDHVIVLADDLDTVDKGYIIVHGDDEYEVITATNRPTGWVLSVLEE